MISSISACDFPYKDFYNAVSGVKDFLFGKYPWTFLYLIQTIGAHVQ